MSRLYNAMFTRTIGTAVDFKHSCCWTNINDEDPRELDLDGIKSETFDVGETLFYTKYGLNLIVKVQSIQLQGGVLRIQVADSNGVQFTITAEYLHNPNNPDIGWIPTSILEYCSSADHLTDEHLECISSPQYLSPLQQEFLSLHHRLFHLPFTVMLRLAKLGILPRKFLKLRNDLPPCYPACLDNCTGSPGKVKSCLRAPAE